jgi:hypothetical protein
MSDLIDKAEELAAKPGRLSRRGFVGRMAKLSAGAMAAVAGLAEFPGSAHAANVVCCNLAFPNNICNSNYEGTNKCPTNCGTSWTWTCSYGANHCPWVCGECYSCSCSFTYPICRSGCPC